jgi:hypothetical protein
MDTTIIPEILNKALTLPDFAIPEYFERESRKTEWSLNVFLNFLNVEIDFLSIQDIKTKKAELDDGDMYRLKKAIFECERNLGLKKEWDNLEIVLWGERDLYLINDWFKKQDTNAALHPLIQFQDSTGGEKTLYRYFISAKYPFANFSLFKKAFIELMLNRKMDNSFLNIMAKSLFDRAKENVNIFNERIYPYENPTGKNEQFKGQSKVVKLNIILDENGVLSYAHDFYFMARQPTYKSNFSLAVYSSNVLGFLNKYFEFIKPGEIEPIVNDVENDFTLSTIEDWLFEFKDKMSEPDYQQLVLALKTYFDAGTFPKLLKPIQINGRPNKKLFGWALNRIFEAKGKGVERELLLFAKQNISLFKSVEYDENNPLQSNLYKYFTTKTK